MLGSLLDGSWAAERLAATGMGRSEAQGKGGLFANAAAALVRVGIGVGRSAVSVFVPGRIEVFGKHTDYCGGRSLLCAVERGLCFVAVPRGDSRVRFRALDLADDVELDLAGEVQPVDGHWSSYVANVVRRIARNFPGATLGADIAMCGDLPKASGMSSSSAMIVGTFMALARVNRLGEREVYRELLSRREDLAGYLGTIENGQSFGPLAGDKGVGTSGGSQDHTAILCCKPGMLSVFSFCPVTHVQDVSLRDGVRFVIADSGVVAEKTRAAREKYNDVSARARELVAVWRETGGVANCLNDAVASGREAFTKLSDAIASLRPTSTASLQDRLDQFYLESELNVPLATRAFADGSWTMLGTIAQASQSAATQKLGNQVSETIALQQAMKANGALAASAFGAGFGGSVWGLFDAAGMEVWKESEAGRSHAWFETGAGCPAMEL